MKDAILQQNEELFDSRSQLTVEQEFSKEGSDVNNFVIQTDAETRRKILSKPKIYIKNSATKPDHYISDMFCRNCCDRGHKHHLNHPTKRCRRQTRCSHCSDAHESDRCPNKNDPSKFQFINCVDHNRRTTNDKAKFKSNHKATDRR